MALVRYDETWIGTILPSGAKFCPWCSDAFAAGDLIAYWLFRSGTPHLMHLPCLRQWLPRILKDAMRDEGGAHVVN